jgi:predicted nucleic acid-binding protein
MNLLDTSVVVDIDRGGVEERVARLDDEGRHAISMVTLASAGFQPFVRVPA